MPYKLNADKARWERNKKALTRKLLTNYLGGECVDCGKGEPEVKLEFDHVLPCEKSFTIARGLSMTWKRLKIEIDKCHLLCHDCHLEKTYGSLPF